MSVAEPTRPLPRQREPMGRPMVALPPPVGAARRITIAATGQLWLELLTHYFRRHSTEHVVASTDDPADVAATCRITEADILILGGQASEGRVNLSIVRELTHEQPTVRVIMLALGTTSQLTAALDAGAVGYLSEACSLDDLDRVVDAVAAGRTCIDPAAISSVVRSITLPLASTQHRSGPVLTPRETDVLRLLADGASTEFIAQRLQVSVNTARTHLKNLMRKLGVGTRLQAAAMGVQRGLI